MSVATAVLRIDENDLRRERDASQRVIQDAHEAALRAVQIAEKVKRMNAIYRERLSGRRAT